MPTQTLMLGDVDIGEYVKQSPIQFSFEEKERKENLQQKINALKQDNLSFEKFFLDGLENELKELNKKESSWKLYQDFGYPEIDLSFLKKSYDKKIGERRIIGFFDSTKEDIIMKVPAFSVYPFYGKENQFSIEYFMWNKSFMMDGKDNDLHIRLILSGIHSVPILRTFSKSMTDWISLDLKEDGLRNRVSWECDDMGDSSLVNDSSGNLANVHYFGANLGKVNRKLFGDEKSHSFRLESYFNGLIPEETKEKVKKSQEYFKKEDIYLIAETKPEEWGVKEVKHDPLVIGMNNEKAYLIDHFNTTPLENLVKDIYVGRRN